MFGKFRVVHALYGKLLRIMPLPGVTTSLCLIWDWHDAKQLAVKRLVPMVY